MFVKQNNMCSESANGAYFEMLFSHMQASQYLDIEIGVKDDFTVQKSHLLAVKKPSNSRNGN